MKGVYTVPAYPGMFFVRVYGQGNKDTRLKEAFPTVEAAAAAHAAAKREIAKAAAGKAMGAARADSDSEEEDGKVQKAHLPPPAILEDGTALQPKPWEDHSSKGEKTVRFWSPDEEKVMKEQASKCHVRGKMPCVGVDTRCGLPTYPRPPTRAPDARCGPRPAPPRRAVARPS